MADVYKLEYFDLRDSIIEEYFTFLRDRVYHFKGACMKSFGLNQYGTDADTHNNLLIFLFQTPFQPLNKLDSNRCFDATEARKEWLKHRFFDRVGAGGRLQQRIEEEAMYYFKPSCLEVLWYMAERLEHTFTSEVNIMQMQLTAQWFWLMLNNLGLTKLGDDIWNKPRAQAIVDRWIALEYHPDGLGGAFYLPNHGDVRMVDLWCQAQWFYADLMKNNPNRGLY